MEQSAKPPEPTKPKSRTILYVIILVVLVVVGAGVYILFQPKGQPAAGTTINIYDNGTSCGSATQCGFNTSTNHNVTIAIHTSVAWVNPQQRSGLPQRIELRTHRLGHWNNELGSWGKYLGHLRHGWDLLLLLHRAHVHAWRNNRQLGWAGRLTSLQRVRPNLSCNLVLVPRATRDQVCETLIPPSPPQESGPDSLENRLTEFSVTKPYCRRI